MPREDWEVCEGLEGAHLVNSTTALLVRWAESAEVVQKLEAFRSEHASAFLRGDDQCEHTHRQYEIFEAFERMFVGELEALIRTELKQDTGDFVRALRSARRDDDHVLRACLSVLDFETFANEMRASERAQKLAADVAADMGL